MSVEANPVAGMNKEDIAALIETGDAEELGILRGYMVSYGYSENGRFIARIDARVLELEA